MLCNEHKPERHFFNKNTNVAATSSNTNPMRATSHQAVLIGGKPPKAPISLFGGEFEV